MAPVADDEQEQSNLPYERDVDRTVLEERKAKATRYERIAFLRRELKQAAGLRPGDSRRGAGAPPCTESRRLRMDLGELDRITVAAAALGLPLETYLRAAALSYADKVRRA